MGMRTAFARTPSHPALAGLNPQQWHDSRGAATLTPPYLDVPDAEDARPDLGVVRLRKYLRVAVRC